MKDQGQPDGKGKGIPARGLVLGVLLVLVLVGCQGKKTPAPSITVTLTSPPVQPTATELAGITETPLFPAATPTLPPAVASATFTLPAPISTETPYQTPYPGPADSPAPIAAAPDIEPSVTPSPSSSPSPSTQEPYPPPPEAPATNEAYPGPVEITPVPGVTEEAYPGPLVSATSTKLAGTVNKTPTPTAVRPVSSPTTPASTPGTANTPAISGSPTPTERVSQPLGTAPVHGGTVTIWHAWSSEKAEALLQIVAAFQKSFPDVRFDVLTLPETELRARYDAEVYNGGGPSLLIGPSDWTAYLVDRQLVEDLNPYISPAFRNSIFPAALGTGSYKDQLACLPLNLSGVLLYRNAQILPTPAVTMDELLTQAEAATRAGKVGAYLERGFEFSFAHLYGLGGQLLDENGAPVFQEQDYRYSLAWVELLDSFAQPGAYSYNDEKDTSIFKQGRAGYVIDGSWNLNALANAIGVQNLAVDPWPTTAQGQLSGYVKAECLYLNINTAELLPEDHLATLRFMGYLMTTPVQVYLAEQGLIPSLQAAEPRDPLLAQAHAALSGGTAYPAVLLSKEGALRPIYQDTLDAALVDIFERGVDPRTALEKALQSIQQRLQELK